MPMWRCPHCGTPQAETARCWVCRRSSTTCSTCRNFRRSVAAQLGYCGLDRRRLPLAGTELRGCWEAGPVRALDVAAVAAVAAFADDEPEQPSPSLRLRGFVPVELVRHRATRAAGQAAPRASRRAGPTPDGPQAAPDPTPDPQPAPSWAERVTLFADAEL